MENDLLESTVIVILDQKEEEIVGFDFISLPEANTVSGIWNLEPGTHFLYIKSKEEEENRMGEFIYFRKGDMKVYRRTKEKNEQVFKQVEEYSNQKYKESIVMGHLKNKMSKIPENLSKLWSNITDCINEELILKLRPINKVIRNQEFKPEEVNEVESDFKEREEGELRKATMRIDLSDTEEDDSKTLEEYKKISKNLSRFSNKVNLNNFKQKRDQTHKREGCQIDKSVEEDYSCIYYSDLPMHDEKMNKFKEITPEMLTNMHMDTSYVLDSIKENYENNKNGYKAEEYENKYLYVLGELQYSFVLFLLCYNFESLHQYKRLLRAFCNAESVLISNSEMNRKFLKTVRYHVEIWDEDHDVYQKDDFLTNALRNLREIIVDNKSQLNSCLEEYKNLEDSFKLKFGISLEDLETLNTNLI